MGIWGFIGSTTEAVKRNAPDATPVTNACKSSYSYTAAAFTKVDEAVAAPVKNACISSYTYGSAAVTKIDQTVRVNGVYKLGQWMPDDEAKSKIGMYALKFAKNAGIYALHEGYKLLPGGVAFSKIIKDTVNDVQFENLKSEKLKMLEENVGSSKKHLLSDRSVRAETDGKGGSVSNDGFKDKSPEDVIRVFMMKDFFATRFFDNMKVHEFASKPE
ncbi:hypothetical protein ACS0TY_017244 [Phlomoides rotata]